MWACIRGELCGCLRGVICVGMYEGWVVWACMRGELCGRV